MKTQINSVVSQVNGVHEELVTQIVETHEELATQIVETQSAVDRVRQQVNLNVDEVRQDVAMVMGRLNRLENESAAVGQINGRTLPSPSVVFVDRVDNGRMVNGTRQDRAVGSNGDRRDVRISGQSRTASQHQTNSTTVGLGESYNQTTNFVTCNAANRDVSRTVINNGNGHIMNSSHVSQAYNSYDRCDEECDMQMDDNYRASERRVSRKQNAVLPPFDGSSSLDVFLNKFRTCSMYYNWSQGDQMFQLTCALTGSAAQYMNSHNGSMRSIDEILSMLQTRFGSANQTELYRVQLKVRRRLPNESLQNFIVDSLSDVLA